MSQNFLDVKVGDTVRRQLGASEPGQKDLTMDLIVSEVTQEFIHCGPWKFDRLTGGEVDEGLEWTATHTGAFLVKT